MVYWGASRGSRHVAIKVVVNGNLHRAPRGVPPFGGPTRPRDALGSNTGGVGPITGANPSCNPRLHTRNRNHAFTKPRAPPRRRVGVRPRDLLVRAMRTPATAINAFKTARI